MAAEVGVAYVRILPSMQGFAGQVRKGMAPVGGVGSKAGTTAGRGFVGGFGASLKGVGGVFAGVFAAKAIVGFVGDTISAASDLGESVNAVNVMFGRAADGILKLGENAAESVGLSQTEFQGMAVQFSAFADTIAGKGGDVVGTIDTISTRAADFASVMNVDVAEAARLFQSGLAGETEPLRRFGIDLSAASVQAFAYANGIAESGTELTEAQKVQARYGSLMEQTAKTQGDFANTSDSLANQQRILSSQWTDMKARLGQALIPAAEGALSVFGRFLPVLEGVFSGGGQASAVFSTLKQVFTGVWEAIKPLIPTVQALAQRFVTILIPGMSRIGALITGTLLPSFQTFFVAVRPILNWLINTIGGALLGAFQGAIQFIEGALQIVAGIFDVFAGIFTGDWSRVWEGVRKIAAGVWDAIKGAFKVFINIGILRLLRVGLSIVKTLFTSAWGAVRSATGAAWAKIRTTLSSAWSRIKTSVRSGLDDVVSFMRGLPSRIVRALGNLGRTLFNAGKDLIRGFINGIKNLAGSITSTIKNTITDKLPGFVKSALGIGSPSKVFAEIGMDVARGMALGISDGQRLVDRQANRLADLTIRSGAPDLARLSRAANASATRALTPAGSSINVENLNVNAATDRFSMQQVQRELALHGVA